MIEQKNETSNRPELLKCQNTKLIVAPLLHLLIYGSPGDKCCNVLNITCLVYNAVRCHGLRTLRYNVGILYHDHK